jgi:ribosomal-protein-alanine N-acetyltransferase
MDAILQPAEARFEALKPEYLDEVVEVERRTYAHPWSRSNFADSLGVSYQAQLLMAETALLAYFVAMKGVDEVHLLNLTVVPKYQRQGWAHVMLDALALWSRGQCAEWLWLEVRIGNLRAIKVYETHGYRCVGRRKDYYPADDGQREDALVMNLRL